MRFGSLFAGIGGLDLGLERAGMKCSWQVELDPWCCQVLQRHWPEVPIYNDVREVGSELEAVDLICGGFPCQDVSVAGRRAGLVGERSGLFHEFMRIVGALTPRWILIENVPGLLSSNGGRDMGTVLGALGQLGYWWTYRSLDTQYFGPPQRRERVFIVGHLGAPCPPEVLLEPESVQGHSPPSREAGEGAAHSIARSPAATGRGVEQVGEGKDQPVVCGTLDSHHGNTRADQAWTDRLVTSILVREGGAHSGFRDAEGVVAHTLRGEGHDASEDGNDGLSDALTSEGPGAVMLAIPRRLTPAECSRLQGFSDDWNAWGVDEDGERVEISDSQRYKQLGNAVSVPVAEWIGHRIMECST